MRNLLMVLVILSVCLSCVTTTAQGTNVNRAELAHEVMNTYEYITQKFVLPISEQPIFSDMSQTQYGIRIEQAYAIGFVNGVGDKLYLPNKEATISEVIVVFYRLICILDPESISQFENGNLINVNVPSWSKIAFEYMNENGIYIIENERFDGMQICKYDELIRISEKIKALYSDENDFNTRISFEQFIQRLSDK